MLELFNDMVKSFGGGPPAATIALLVVAVVFLVREWRKEAKAHIETVKQILPVANSSAESVEGMTAALKENTAVMREMREALLLARAKSEAHELAQNRQR